MADFNIRSESVDVEQIMKQIRTRIREKRGVDYTEEQIRELASVRLEKFLDPKNLRSDLLDQFRKSRPALPQPPAEPPPVEAPFVFDDETLFQSHRGPLRFLRRLLKPILKLFFNYNTLNQLLHTQAQFNVDLLKRDLRRRVELQQHVASFERSRGEWNVLYYEVLHNLVLETTRNGIELKNMKMRLEALASRLDFSERRVRALEGVVQYRPEAVRPPRDRDRDRDQSRDRDRDQPREQNRGRDRQPRQESAPVAPEDASLAPAVVSAAAAGPTAAGEPDAGGAAGAGGPETGGAGGAGGGAPGDPGTRRRRRRRRGRRGTGMPSGSAPVAGDQSAAGDNAGGGDEGFDEGDDAPEGDVEAAGQAENDEPGPGTPPDPDAQ